MGGYDGGGGGFCKQLQVGVYRCAIWVSVRSIYVFTVLSCIATVKWKTRMGNRIINEARSDQLSEHTHIWVCCKEYC